MRRCPLRQRAGFSRSSRCCTYHTTRDGISPLGPSWRMFLWWSGRWRDGISCGWLYRIQRSSIITIKEKGAAVQSRNPFRSNSLIKIFNATLAGRVLVHGEEVRLSFRLSLFHGAQVWFGNAVNVNSFWFFLGRLGFSCTQTILERLHVHVEGGQDEVAMGYHGDGFGDD